MHHLIKICCYSIVCTLLSIVSLRAQQGLGACKGQVQRSGNTYTLATQYGTLRLEFCSPSTVRIRAVWQAQYEPNEPWMVVRYAWPAVPVQLIDRAGEVVLSTSQMQVRISRATAAVALYNSQGALITTTAAGGLSRQGEQPVASFALQPEEQFFGFGERMDFLNQRGKKLKLDVGRGKGRPHEVGAYNVLEANYCPIPFFMSTAGYGVFFHNSYATYWDMGATRPNVWQLAADGGELDVYIMVGPALADILNAYTDLTGKAPLMPRFALGLHIGTYSGGTWGYEQYTSDTYVLLLALKLRAMGIPVDILHLDSVWRIFGKVGGKGATSFEWRPTFRNPQAMFDSLYALGFNMVGMHIRPRFDNGNTLKLLDTAQLLGHTFPEANGPGEFVNFFDSKAVDWWWEHGVMRLARQGAMFLKTDEGSAFGALANESEKLGPTGKEAQRLHNIFPLAYAKAPYEKFAAHNGMRGMNHTREGYAGIQRYPFIFAGDWPSEWQYFAPVIKAGLNIGISGVGNWAHCMGGFEHVADPELYIRWTQFGLLSPVAHLFGMDHPHYKEPWHYGPEALSIFKHYDSLRYRLIPYLYSHQYEMYTTGMPLMRALVLHHQYDVNVYDIADQYMLGSSLMVCPVTTKGAKTRTVYLPEGEWIDYHSGKKYQGKQYIQVVTPLHILPIFVKAGAIIPAQPAMAYVGERPVDTITLHLYPGNGSFALYDDDGKTMQYQQGRYCITQMQATLANHQYTLTMSKPAGNYKPAASHYRWIVHAGGKKIQSIMVNGKAQAVPVVQPNHSYVVEGQGGNSTTEAHRLSISFAP